MIDYTERLDNAVRIAAWAHEQAGQHRKGTDIPYIIHPIGVMIAASNITDDEDILIACLMHDILEDVTPDIYGEDQMRADFGDRVVDIVRGVTKDNTKTSWHSQAEAYLEHLENKASYESVVVSAADKVHNLMSILIDHDKYGDKLWERFSTKSAKDQLWYYESVLNIVSRRNIPEKLQKRFNSQLTELKNRI